MLDISNSRSRVNLMEAILKFFLLFFSIFLGLFLGFKSPIIASDYSPEEVHISTFSYQIFCEKTDSNYFCTTTLPYIDEISDAPEEASFYLDKRISYGDLAIFSVLLLFLIFKIFAICWNFIFPKSFKALTTNDL